VPNFRIRARIYSRTDRRRADKKVDVITNPQITAATPDMAIPFGLKARYGAQFQTGDRPFRQ
jgi:hypothetical protein